MRIFPSAASIADPRGPFLVPLMLLALSRGVLWTFLPYASEDAYITFRYARSLAGGLGLVYNPGERVMGFTSPLWTLWSALGIRLVHDPVLWSRATTMAADVMTLLIMGELLRRHASSLSAWCFTAFFAVWPYFAAVALSGMESGAMLGLLLLSAASIEARSPWAGVALGALALMRPEGLACASVLALGASWRGRGIGLGIAAIGWGAMAVYFGSPVPQSVMAKATLYGTPGFWSGRFWWEWLSPFPLGRYPTISEGYNLMPLNVLMAPGAVLGAIAVWKQRRTGLALAIAAALALWVGYLVLGVAYFYWYFLVPVVGIAALAAIGLPALTRSRAVFAAVALYVVGFWTIAPQLYIGRAQNEFFGFAPVANYLSSHATPGQKVMLEPIGMVGWQCPLVIVDEVGLVSPQVTRRRLEGPGWYADLAIRERPDWLVTRRGLVSSGRAFAGVGAPFRSEAERDSVFARYQQVSVSDEVSGENALLVMQRVR